MIYPLHPSLTKAACRTDPWLFIQFNGLGLNSSNEKEHDESLFKNSMLNAIDLIIKYQ